MRFDYATANPEAAKAMIAFNRYTRETSLEPLLIELIKIRASQINGCAFCLDMHTQDALKLGESNRRLHVLAAWRESTFFTERERAALLFTDTLTLISTRGVPDEVYEEVRRSFNEKEMMDLITIINVINCWNRIAVTSGKEPPELVAGER